MSHVNQENVGQSQGIFDFSQHHTIFNPPKDQSTKKQQDQLRFDYRPMSSQPATLALSQTQSYKPQMPNPHQSVLSNTYQSGISTASAV